MAETPTNRRAQERAIPFAPFATFERGRGLVELRCRVCSAVIAKPAPVGAQRMKRVKNQTFIETDMAFTYLAPYRELDVEMENGGRHILNACVDCAPKLQADPDLLARACETDLAQWRSEGHTITEKMDRRPVSVRRVDGAILD